MESTLSVCPVCTEFGTTPITLKTGRNGHKYRCPSLDCGAEYWIKVTKGPIPNYDSLTANKYISSEYCLQLKPSQKRHKAKGFK